MISADTSFLFSFYGNDSNSEKALAWNKQNTQAIAISPLNTFELINALRFSEFRKTIARGDADRFAAQFQQDLSSGRLIEAPARLEEILAEAKRLSATRTLTGGHRGFDILHVAAARIMAATHFLTFDANQKRLAKHEGFALPL